MAGGNAFKELGEAIRNLAAHSDARITALTMVILALPGTSEVDFEMLKQISAEAAEEMGPEARKQSDDVVRELDLLERVARAARG